MTINVGDFVAGYYEVRRIDDNKRIGMVQVADDKNHYYERFKTDKDGSIIYDEKLRLYEREYKKEPIKFVRNASYFIIIKGLLKYYLEAIKGLIKMEINIRKKVGEVWNGREERIE